MHSIAWWPTVVVVAIATITDLRCRRIPNWLVFPYLAAGIAVSSWLQGWQGAGRSLAGMGLAIVICGLFYWLGGLGAGDLKLCAAIGAWTAWTGGAVPNRLPYFFGEADRGR